MFKVTNVFPSSTFKNQRYPITETFRVPLVESQSQYLFQSCPMFLVVTLKQLLFLLKCVVPRKEN